MYPLLQKIFSWLGAILLAVQLVAPIKYRVRATKLPSPSPILRPFSILNQIHTEEFYIIIANRFCWPKFYNIKYECKAPWGVYAIPLLLITLKLNNILRSGIWGGGIMRNTHFYSTKTSMNCKKEKTERFFSGSRRIFIKTLSSYLWGSSFAAVPLFRRRCTWSRQLWPSEFPQCRTRAEDQRSFPVYTQKTNSTRYDTTKKKL